MSPLSTEPEGIYDGNANLSYETFESTILDNALVLVDFWGGYRGPCRARHCPVKSLDMETVHAKIAARKAAAAR